MNSSTGRTPDGLSKFYASAPSHSTHILSERIHQIQVDTQLLLRRSSREINLVAQHGERNVRQFLVRKQLLWMTCTPSALHSAPVSLRGNAPCLRRPRGRSRRPPSQNTPSRAFWLRSDFAERNTNHSRDHPNRTF